MVPLEPKHAETGDAAAQSVQNVKDQGCGKLRLSLGENLCKKLAEMLYFEKKLQNRTAPEPRPNHARTTMVQKMHENGKKQKTDKTRTTPEPRPNHMCKPKDRSDSKDATPFHIFQRNMNFMEKT